MSRVCDFCDKHEHAVIKLIERKFDELNRQAVHICDECVERCLGIIKSANAAHTQSKGDKS